ncbi:MULTISPECIES: GDSL-type esterase/lipase family protein [unclassified Spirosoma]|uniref:GDSL-type esterase/lipase family protein n=1 Tax=unclassified Spirosoma TaxID=2621999 RepID=UPI000966B290|nr:MULTISPECIES: GDSL-type esterase/lipase family protein [unclassified Spirosoma]MBN8821912.1 G-D-S-L family lipolytic protein [Spirosoma sp.]OJW80894.1 MAG: G-D-S-L family lipolytic protein [Spirosoma sp. 48-14]
MRFLLPLAFLLVLSIEIHAQKVIRIACVGNSITYGAGLTHREQNSFPAQLQYLLGSGYTVMNFGVSGRTVLRETTAPYISTDSYQEALKSNPDIVLIKLGTNDSRLPYRLKIDQFIPDYKALVQSFKDLPTHPRIVLLLPVASFLTDTTRQTEAAIKTHILPRIRQVAFDEKLELVDLHSLTLEDSLLFPDKLHPAPLVMTRIARRLYEVITTKTQSDFDIFQKIKEPKKITSFYGYDCADFTFEGRACKVVKPRIVAQNKPWIWRARFWGHEPQTDIALLDHGFHLVYCDVAELFGNAEAVGLWNKFYRYMHKAGLADKVTLEGLSRGGVYAYNWAVENPKKVACVYVDAPVLDLKSWPGGKGKSKGSPSDWEIFKKDYGLKSEEEALQFKGNPLDRVPDIVKGNFPMLHVVGDADDAVPVSENTEPFEKQALALGGRITVIHKPGVNHHPHSLPNPSPIVDFILKSVGLYPSYAQMPVPGSEYRSAGGWKQGNDWWDNFNNIQQTLDSTGKLDVLLMGNSITQAIGKRSLVVYHGGQAPFDSALAGYRYGVAAISGDKTQHLLWRVENLDFTKSDPALVVVTIGVNNFSEDEAEAITAGIGAIVKSLRRKLPQAKLVLVGPLPAGTAAGDEKRKKYTLVHQQIQAFVDNKTIFFCDPSGALIDTATGNLVMGTYSGDGIHLARKGYTIWATALRQTIDKIGLPAH